tara:strand:+ start:1639 stop:2163 length:525 start_codon:yes stop_codon:yes gene_type:complete
MEATNKGEDSMDIEAIKAEAQKLGLPTAEEMYLFAERMNGFRHSDLLEASGADVDTVDYEPLREYANYANFVKRCAGSVSKEADKLYTNKAEENSLIEEGDFMVLRNCSPKYLNGVVVMIHEIEKRDKGKTIIWARIAEDTGKSRSFGDIVGYPASCFSDATVEQKNRSPFYVG